MVCVVSDRKLFYDPINLLPLPGQSELCHEQPHGLVYLDPPEVYLLAVGSEHLQVELVLLAQVLPDGLFAQPRGRQQQLRDGHRVVLNDLMLQQEVDARLGVVVEQDDGPLQNGLHRVVLLDAVHQVHEELRVLTLYVPLVAKHLFTLLLLLLL